MRHLPASATLAFNQKVREHIKSGKEIISLGLGEAEIPTPPHIVDAGIKALRDGKTKYSTPQGLPVLRERIAQRLKTIHGIAAVPEQIIVTPGAKNALFLACASLLERGDEVVLLRPCYVSNMPILHLAMEGVVVHEVDMTPASFDLDRQLLASAVTKKTKLLFINTPHNPTGRMLTASDIDFIAALMMQYPGLHLLSDEVYEAMTVGETRHIAPASINAVADRVITVGGFSKTYFMTGWRIGYVHASKALTRAMLSTHEHINTNTAAFIQDAAIAALEGPQDCVTEYVQKLRERKSIYDRLLARSSVLRGTAFDGGYFTFIDISASKMDGDAFSVALLEQKNVAVVPGLAFGAHCSRYCRLSFVNRTELFEEGLDRIRHFIETRAL